MTVLNVVRMGHPVLRRRADEVADPTAPEVATLVADMVETMIAAGGRGLAAPQVGVPLRLVVFHAPMDDETLRTGDLASQPLTVLINPVVRPLTDRQEDGWEGCLSLPGLAGIVPRYPRIRYTGVSDKGEPIDRVANAFHARVVQHEVDHLDGILYPQRMRDLRALTFLDAGKDVE